MWRDGTDTMGAMGYDPSTLTQNGVAPQHIMPTLQYGRHYGQVSTFLFYQQLQIHKITNNYPFPSTNITCYIQICIYPSHKIMSPSYSSE